MPGDLLPFLMTRIKKTVAWKTTFVSEHLDTDQSQSTKCFALIACFDCCILGDSQLTALPGKPCEERKTHIRLPLSCVLSDMHTFALIQMPRCVV